MLLPHVLPYVGDACVLVGTVMSLVFGLWWGPAVLGGTRLWNFPKGQRLFQFWLNFAGSAAGWVIAYAYLTRPSLGTIGFADLFLILASFVGITGFLPAMLVPSALGFKDAFQAWINIKLPPAPSSSSAKP